MMTVTSAPNVLLIVHSDLVRCFSSSYDATSHAT